MDIPMDIHEKICGYGCGYGWEILYPRQPWKNEGQGDGKEGGEGGKAEGERSLPRLRLSLITPLLMSRRGRIFCTFSWQM